MKSVTFSIPNISCNHCTHTITMELSDLEGVSKVDADLQSKMVTVTYEEPATEQNLRETLIAINYPPAD
ncbi:MAG: heavy-metal-associated domain-containing protein [Anaerolineales bacterium]